MRRLLQISPIVVILCVACGSRDAAEPRAEDAVAEAPAQVCFYLPPGDAAAGRETCLVMGCAACHKVEAAGFPAPVATPAVSVVLGPDVARRSRAELAESIVAPSHKIPEGLANVSEGKLSRMGNYTDSMTVRELVDLIAFIQSIDERENRTM